MYIKNKLKKDYKYQFSIFNQAFIDHDPVGLIDGGAPDDEYDNEINKLLSELESCTKEDDLKKLIVDIFSEIGEINVLNAQKATQIIWSKLKL